MQRVAVTSEREIITRPSSRYVHVTTYEKMITVSRARNLAHKIGRRSCKKRSISLSVLTYDETMCVMQPQGMYVDNVIDRLAIARCSSLRVQRREFKVNAFDDAVMLVRLPD